MPVKIISKSKGHFQTLTNTIQPEVYSGMAFINALKFSDVQVEYVTEDELHGDRDYIFLIEPQWTPEEERLGYEHIFRGAIKEIPNSIKEKIKSYNIKVIISTINEPWGLEPVNVIAPNLKDCIREGVSQNKCLILVGNHKVNDIESKGIKKIVKVINYWPFHYYSPDWLGDLNTEKINLKKHFVCLNRTIKTHRTALLFHLYNNQLLDNGYVSFYSEVNGLDYFKHKNNFEPTYNYPTKNFKQIDKLLPLRIEEEVINPNEDNPTYFGAVKRIEKVFRSSFMNVVTETWTSNDLLFLSEKIYKPIFLRQPFLVVGNPYTIKYLRDNGFDVFDDIFDHSYDEELDENKRLEMVVGEIKKICDKPLEHLDELLISIDDRLTNNRKHFFRYYMKKQKNLIRGLI
tara:strand:- start:2716 stop:3921 length:1206 start_codon:yes stop_codon:yes gene_type:complete